MEAMVYDRYGGPEGLRPRDISVPDARDGTVIVRVRAASVNPFDLHMMRGVPYVMRLSEGARRPKRRVPGVDVAGIVESVGAGVTRFKPGDEVFGACAGSLAELVRARERVLLEKPPGMTFEQAATVPAAGCTAMQALRDKASVGEGTRVLINGAAGGVGTFAVQIARSFGADVTGVCSTRNVETVLALGAQRVVDYTAEDFTRERKRYDVIVDAVGNRSLRHLRRALSAGGHIVMVGGTGGRLLGPLPRALAAAVSSRVGRHATTFFIATVTEKDLRSLADLLERGSVVPVIDRCYPLRQAPEALRYLATGRARGKVVVTVP